jgi:hypothetical protein
MGIYDGVFGGAWGYVIFVCGCKDSVFLEMFVANF